MSRKSDRYLPSVYHAVPVPSTMARYWLLLVMVVTAAASDQYHDYSYDYGDPNYDYDDPVLAERLGHVESAPGGAAPPQASPLPLCCPAGSVYDYIRCRSPSQGVLWEPYLDASPSAAYVYTTGFPRCPNKRADLHQTEVFITNTTLYVPHFVQLQPVPASLYCVVRVEDPQDGGGTCPRYGTKVYACIDGDKAMGPGAWTLVGLAHCLLLVSIAAFVGMSQLRVLQGQYLLCLLVTLLLYDVLEFPTSALSFPTSVVSCYALKSIKYFFFCGVFLWYNVVCFDVWRTLRSGKDIGGRRRFVLYSAYTWLCGALLVTPVMVLTIRAGTGTDQVPGTDLPVCSVGLGAHVVLQLVQGLTMVTNAVMLGLAASHLCRYTKLGCGLPRAEAAMCLKQTAKLYVVMVFHAVFSVSPDILDVQVIQLWQYMVLESVAIFAILVYRRSIIKKVRAALCRRCSSCCSNRCSPADVPYGAGVYEVSMGPHSVQGSGNGLHGPSLQSVMPEKVRLSAV